MGLKTVYDNSNKVTDVGLSVTYRQTWVQGTYWKVVRIAKKSYKFIGMDQATAFQCASAKRTQYTRTFTHIQVTDSGVSANTTIECPSDIAPRHVEGGAWEVQIEVNEMDSTYSNGPSADPASLFPVANARNYDEDAGTSTLTLDSVARSGTSLAFTYTQAISGFDPAALICQYKTSESATTWTTAPRVTTDDASPVTVPDWAVFAMLRYGSFESNILQST